MAKTKVSFSIEPKLQAEAECLMKTVECSSMSEFYEKAVQFYVLHLHLKHNESYFGGFKPYGDNALYEIEKFAYFSKAAGIG